MFTDRPAFRKTIGSITGIGYRIRIAVERFITFGRGKRKPRRGAQMIMTKTEVSIRWMIRRDLERVVEIDRATFDDPYWDADAFSRFLRDKNSVALIAETRIGTGDKTIVGSTLYHAHKHYVTIRRMSVAPEARRSGIATEMMRRIKSKLNERRRFMEFVVPDTRTDGHLFLRADGWTCVQVLRNDFGGGIDGYLFQYPRDKNERC